jgi:serine/threonine protein kinase
VGAIAGALVVGWLALFLVRRQRRRRHGAVGKSGDNYGQPLLAYSAPVALAVHAGSSINGGVMIASGGRRPAQEYSYAQLSLATGGFAQEHMLDEGSFGAVYRGRLAGGRVVAIKVLKADAAKKVYAKGSQEWSGAGGFRKELEVLLRYRHINIVRLLGHCLGDAAQEQQCLVLEFMEGGSLHSRLAVARAASGGGGRKGKGGKKGKKAAMATPLSLTAHQRFAIASDVARGLEYLHVDADPPLIHQDVKSGNILLSEYNGQLVAKVADFGTARFAPKLLTGTHHTTRNVVGTGPYMPLEYMQSGHVSERTDTFAFGVVLCELLTGGEPVDFEKGEVLSQQMYVPLEDPERLLPPFLDSSAGAWPLPRAAALGRITRRCIEMEVTQRCLVADVLSELDALAGRRAVVRAGRGQEYDPVTGNLVNVSTSTTGSPGTRPRPSAGQCPPVGRGTDGSGSRVQSSPCPQWAGTVNSGACPHCGTKLRFRKGIALACFACRR